MVQSSELRMDPVSRRWVIFQTYTQSFSSRFKHLPIKLKENNFNKVKVSSVTNENCPFCVGNEHLVPNSLLEYGEKKEDGSYRWWVRVFPSSDKVISTDEQSERTPSGIYDKITGFGANEIVVENPFHDRDTFTCEPFYIKEALLAYRQRIQYYKQDSRIKYVSFSRNIGVLAGQKFSHSYGHIIATPAISKKINTELNNSREHFALKERCIFCDIIAEELASGSGSRIVHKDDDFLVFAPFASRFPFELTLIPIYHEVDFENTSTLLIEKLSLVIHKIFKIFYRCLVSPNYIVVLHNGPNRNCKKVPNSWQTVEKDFHWHLEIIPILQQIAAFEVGTGIYINSVLPEEATKYLLLA